MDSSLQIFILESLRLIIFVENIITSVTCMFSGADYGPFQTPLHTCAEPNCWISYGRIATFESVWYGSFRLGTANDASRCVCRIMPHWSGSWFKRPSSHAPNLMHELLLFIFGITAPVMCSKSTMTIHAWSLNRTCLLRFSEKAGNFIFMVFFIYLFFFVITAQICEI